LRTDYCVPVKPLASPLTELGPGGRTLESERGVQGTVYRQYSMNLIPLRLYCTKTRVWINCAFSRCFQHAGARTPCWGRGGKYCSLPLVVYTRKTQPGICITQVHKTSANCVVSTAIRYRTRAQRQGGDQMAPHLAIHESELGAPQPSAPQVPRERGVCAQRRRLLLVWYGLLGLGLG